MPIAGDQNTSGADHVPQHESSRSIASGANLDTSLSDRDFTVLNTIYLKKLADTSQIAGLCAFEKNALQTFLDDAVRNNLIMSTDSGYLLLPQGTTSVQRHYREAYAGLRSDPAVARWYAEFEALNARFIAAITAWQQTGGDDLLFKALDDVEQLCAALDELLPLLPRYADYRRRFEASLAAVESGDTDLLCNPRRDSAHNIWFEFHEDILGVLGRPRDST